MGKEKKQQQSTAKCLGVKIESFFFFLVLTDECTLSQETTTTTKKGF